MFSDKANSRTLDYSTCTQTIWKNCEFKAENWTLLVNEQALSMTQSRTISFLEPALELLRKLIVWRFTENGYENLWKFEIFGILH